MTAPRHSDQCVAIGGGPGHDECVCYCHRTLPSVMTDLDRGAVAALDLLLRGEEYQTGDETMHESAENLRDAVKALGLRTVIANHREFELTAWDADEVDDLPSGLAALMGEPRSILETLLDDL